MDEWMDIWVRGRAGGLKMAGKVRLDKGAWEVCLSLVFMFTWG